MLPIEILIIQPNKQKEKYLLLIQMPRNSKLNFLMLINAPQSTLYIITCLLILLNCIKLHYGLKISLQNSYIEILTPNGDIRR